MASRVGDLLIQKGLIDQQQLSKAIDLAKQNSCLVNQALIQLAYIEESALLNFLSEQYNLPVVKLEEIQIATQLLTLIPQRLAQKHHVLPLELNNNTLTLAMVDPSDIIALNEVKFITGHDIKVVLASEGELKTQTEKLYETDVSYDDLFDGLVEEDNVEVLSTEDNIDISALEKATEDAPVVKLVNAILTDGIKKGSSDIHLEPYEKSFRVRFRIDGVL